MNSIRKWLYKPKKTDQSLLAQFFYADEDLNAVAAELDSFDGRKDPERCTALVNHLRQCQDKVLNICQMIMDEIIPEERAPRDFRAKFPDDVLQENLAGQLWFGAECLAAGSSILNRELESATMRPLAKALTKSLENVRNLLREQCFRSPPEFTEKICESLKILDRLFAEFELNYVSAMVPVKSVHEYEAQQAITVLFSETLQRALRLDLLSQDQVDSCDPLLMFTIPRLAIVAGLLIFPEGPLCLSLDRGELSDMFRPFRSLLLKIRELLWTLNRTELSTLERSLCSADEPTIEPSDLVDSNPENVYHNTTDIMAHNHHLLNQKENKKRNKGKISEYPVATQSIQDYLDQLYKDFPHCKEFISDMCCNTTSTNSNNTDTENEIEDDKTITNEKPVNTSTTTSSATTTSNVKGTTNLPENVSTNSTHLNFHLITTALAEANAAVLANNQHHFANFSSNSFSDSSLNSQSQSLTSFNIHDQEIIIEKGIESENHFNLQQQQQQNQDSAELELNKSGSSSNNGLIHFKEEQDINQFTFEGESNKKIENSKVCDESISSSQIEENNQITNNVQHQPLNFTNKSEEDLPTPIVEVRGNGSVLVESKSTSNSTSHSSSSSRDSGLSSMATEPEKPNTNTEVGTCNISNKGANQQINKEKSSSSKQEGEKSSNTTASKTYLEVPPSEHFEDSLVADPVQQQNRLNVPNSSQDLTCCSGCNSECGASIGDESNCETSSFDSECHDIGDLEIALAMQAAEIASRNEVRARFKNTADLIHRLFICISGVADQLQTNYAADLRSTLKCVFAMNATPVEESPSVCESSGGDNSTGPDITPEPSLDEEPTDDFQSIVESDHHHLNVNTVRVESSQHSIEVISPPTWVPDQLASQCMACNASFTVVRRRHHCRNCGKIFCGKCSGNSTPLPMYGHTKPVRVCNRCFLYSVTPFTLPSASISQSS